MRMVFNRVVFKCVFFCRHCAEILNTEEWAALDEANPHLAHSLMRATILAGNRKRKRLTVGEESVPNNDADAEAD